MKLRIEARADRSRRAIRRLINAARTDPHNYHDGTPVNGANPWEPHMGTWAELKKLDPETATEEEVNAFRPGRPLVGAYRPCCGECHAEYDYGMEFGEDEPDYSQTICIKCLRDAVAKLEAKGASE